MKFQSFEFETSDVIPVNALTWHPCFVNIMKKGPSTRLYGFSVHFPRSYEVEKFWIIRRRFNVSDNIPANEHTSSANCLW